MAKVTLSTITSGYQDANAINDNFEALATALENTLSRDGTTPNTLEADLDLNGNLILNQGSNPTSTDFSYEGDWVTSTAYAVNDLVYVTVAADATNGGSTYICRTAHTSGTFSTDYTTNSYWDLVAKRGASGAGSGDLLASNSLGDIVSGGGSTSTARSNLGLGGAAVLEVGVDSADDVLTTTNMFTSSSLTISGGSVTPTKAVHTLEPESGTSDNLDTLATGSVVDGIIVLVRCNDSGDTITIRDATGNIYTRDSSNITLDDTEKSVSFQRRGSDWYEVSRSFIDASSGNTWTYVTKVSGTAVNGIEFTDLNQSSDHMFIITGIKPATNADNYNVRTSASSGSSPSYDATSGNYAYYYDVNGTSFSTNSSSSGELLPDVGNGTGEYISGTLYLMDPGNSSLKTGWRFDGTGAYNSNHVIARAGGIRNSAAVVQAIKFFWGSGGNHAAQGQIEHYRRAKN